jgi:CspA family cold shock protein
MKGKVKWFNQVKGYGFIKGDEDGQEVFVHYKELVDKSKRELLVEGAAVDYGVTTGPRGVAATGVSLV